jgi:hypothetical protein
MSEKKDEFISLTGRILHFDYTSIEQRVLAKHAPELERLFAKHRRRKVEKMDRLRHQSVLHRKRQHSLPDDRQIRLKLCRVLAAGYLEDIDAWLRYQRLATSVVETEIRNIHRRLL